MLRRVHHGLLSSKPTYGSREVSVIPRAIGELGFTRRLIALIISSGSVYAIPPIEDL